MHSSFSFRIYKSCDELPSRWDTVASGNIFLSRDYLAVLEKSAPENMACRFIGIFEGNELTGVAVCQLLDFTDVNSFGERDHCIKNTIRTFFFKRFSSRVLIVGNNMLTGQNAFRFAEKPRKELVAVLSKAVKAICAVLKNEGRNPNLIIWKDFLGKTLPVFDQPDFDRYFKFTTQPNMIFDIRSEWKNEPDYISCFVKKYRDQYKRARKKLAGVERRQIHLPEIEQLNDTIYGLYLNVARNAPFNTFYLHRDHFVTMKRELGDRFRLYGYFSGGRLIGFSTIIANGTDIDTYFLGYDEEFQREKMLYLNMLYDMIAYSVINGYKRIIFARTALEIKSSVGACPMEMYGFIRHRNRIINSLMPTLFKYFEPESKWQQRHPFKS